MHVSLIPLQAFPLEKMVLMHNMKPLDSAYIIRCSNEEPSFRGPLLDNRC